MRQTEMDFGMDSTLAAKIDALRDSFLEKLVERRVVMAAAMEEFTRAIDAPSRDSVLARDPALAKLEDVAHQLSGSSGLFGFDELGTAAATFEHACRHTRQQTPSQNHDDASARESAKQLTSSWNAMTKILDAMETL